MYLNPLYLEFCVNYLAQATAGTITLSRFGRHLEEIQDMIVKEHAEGGGEFNGCIPMSTATFEGIELSLETHAAHAKLDFMCIFMFAPVTKMSTEQLQALAKTILDKHTSVGVEKVTSGDLESLNAAYNEAVLHNSKAISSQGKTQIAYDKAVADLNRAQAVRIAAFDCMAKGVMKGDAGRVKGVTDGAAKSGGVSWVTDAELANLQKVCIAAIRANDDAMNVQRQAQLAYENLATAQRKAQITFEAQLKRSAATDHQAEASAKRQRA